MNRKNILTSLKVIVIPVVYALLLRIFFGVKTWRELYSVMSVTFLVCLPAIVGALTVFFSPVGRVQKLAYRIFAPWIPILIFFVITLVCSIEGWACWVMALPLFLVAASLGGLFGGYFKLKKKRDNVYICVLVLLPFLISPLEQLIGSIPANYRAYTHIDISSSPQKIWKNVTSVYTIPEKDDHGWLTRFLGFPRPVKAVLNFNGVGARREAVFTKGLVFHETVLSYEDLKKMVFSIKAYPYEIPSTTMDDHIVVGGDYFDVLNGTYELERLDDTTCRLRLYSNFKMTTTFNFYAGWWARWIMQDIQNNILQVIKNRAEKGK